MTNSLIQNIDMAALKIIIVLALIALVTAKPPGGAGEIADQVEGGEEAGVKAGKGASGQGKQLVDQGEDGAKGVEDKIEDGVGKAGKESGAGKGAAKKALGASAGFLGPAKGIFDSFLGDE